jgi:hypothetical protein
VANVERTIHEAHTMRTARAKSSAQCIVASVAAAAQVHARDSFIAVLSPIHIAPSVGDGAFQRSGGLPGLPLSRPLFHRGNDRVSTLHYWSD